MSESRKRSNDSISLSEENTESPADDGIEVDNNYDNVGIEDDHHGYHDENDNDESKDDDDDDDDDDEEDDSNDDEDYEDYEGDQHGYHDDEVEVDDSEDDKPECNYDSDSDRDYSDFDEEEDDDEDDEDDEEEHDSDDVMNDNHPLHRAMRRKESSNTIFPLIEAYMKTVQHEEKDDKRGDFLLNLACLNCEANFVMKFIELFPKSIQQKDEHGDYPLHIACCHQSNDVIMKLILLFPMAVQHQNRDTYYPLHLACIHGGSEHVVMILLCICPKAASHNVLTHSGLVKRNGRTGFALHMACRYVYSMVVIRKLIEIDRVALRKKDCKGNYPLHCAMYRDEFIDRNQWIDLLNLFMDEDPLAMLRFNSKGDSPFHTAYRCNNQTFFEVMINEDEALVNMKNRYGKTLLHYAASSYNFCKDEIIDMLFQHPCTDVNINDNNNNTPLHIAAMNQNLEIAQKLLDHRFILIDEKNNENKTPLDILKEKTKEIEEYLAHGSDSYFMMKCNKEKLSKCLEFIQLLEAYLIKKRKDAYLYHFNAMADL